MHHIIAAQPDYLTTLAPRLILGLWHPRFIQPALRHVPYLRRAHIGMSLRAARTYFWHDCEAFSLNFAALWGRDGDAFRKECADAGKKVVVWCVHHRQVRRPVADPIPRAGR